MFRRFGPYRRVLLRGFGAITLVLILGLALVLTPQLPTASRQQGYRGTGMVALDDDARLKAKVALNQAPAIHAPARARANAPIAGKVYKNVQVLGDLTIGEFGRTMTAMTEWVAGKDSCVYCHVEGNFVSDDKYTKVVARRMLQMVNHLNSNWKPHTGQTGVTCYTCHRGQGLPAQRWFLPEAEPSRGLYTARQREFEALPQVGLAALPVDAYTAFLLQPDGAQAVRVASATALVTGPRASVQHAEKTYSLMIHISQSLGVNCTFCHNSRSFAAWTESTPARVTAWQGLRMVRDVNAQFMTPLAAVFPAVPAGRLGPLADAAKIHCATCHQGVNKPLYGARIAAAYPALQLPYAVPAPPVAASAPEPAASAPAEAASAPVPEAPASAASGVELMAAAPAAPAPALPSLPVVTAPSAPSAPAASRPGPAASGVVTVLAPPPASAAAPVAVNCIDVGAAASKVGTLVARDAVARQVNAGAPLAFYSAPNAGCEMLGVSLQPGEAVEATMDHAGYTAVRNRRAQSGVEVKGWVRSDRLAPVVVARAPAVVPPAAAAAPVAGDCAAAESAAAKGRREIAAAASRRVVAGAGRLQFHSAPDLACRQNGVFILTGEAVVALAQFGEFTRVRYVNPRTGGEALGWVQSARLSSP